MVRFRRYSKAERSREELKFLYRIVLMMIMDSKKDSSDARYEVLNDDGHVEWEVTIKRKV